MLGSDANSDTVGIFAYRSFAIHQRLSSALLTSSRINNARFSQRTMDCAVHSFNRILAESGVAMMLTGLTRITWRATAPC